MFKGGEAFGLSPGGFTDAASLLFKGGCKPLFDVFMISLRTEYVQIFPSFKHFGMGAIPIIHDVQRHCITKSLTHFLKTIGQASLNFCHDIDARPPSVFIKTNQGIFKRVFGQCVNRKDLRLPTRIHRLPDFGNTRRRAR